MHTPRGWVSLTHPRYDGGSVRYSGTITSTEQSSNGGVGDCLNSVYSCELCHWVSDSATIG